MPDTTVKYFDSTMTGAPAMASAAGSLIAILDACLVNGFGAVTLNSLVVSGNVATGTVGGGHGFSMVGGLIGPVILIDGATPSALNGEWRLESVPNSTTFTFTTSGIADQTATGTISAKRAPLGFAKAFSVTNKAAYRSNDVSGTRLFLRVDDTPTSPVAARAVGYEGMTDIDSGSAPFPTAAQLSGGVYWYRGSINNWVLLGDAKRFVLLPRLASSDNARSAWLFGDILSWKIGDAHHCAIGGGWINDSTQYTVNNSDFYFINAVGVTLRGHYLARGYSGVSGAVQAVQMGAFTPAASQIGTSGPFSYPDPTTGGLVLTPVLIIQGTATRGARPYMYQPLHARPLGDKAVVAARLATDTRAVMAMDIGFTVSQGTSCAVFDITGPWS